MSARAVTYGCVLHRNCRAIGLPVGQGMTTARRSPASHTLHCPRLPGRRNIRLFGAASGARRSGSQSAQSWPISAHLRRDCERPIMAMNRWLPVTIYATTTRLPGGAPRVRLARDRAASLPEILIELPTRFCHRRPPLRACVPWDLNPQCVRGDLNTETGEISPDRGNHATR